MNKNFLHFLFLVCLISLVGCVKSNEPKTSTTRNPFGVKDVGEINYGEVKKFASESVLNGAENDPNAEKWATPQSMGAETGTIEGSWSSRWNGGAMGSEWQKGKAQIKKVNEVYFILYEDNGKYLIEGKIEKDSLIGKYVNQNNETDAGPWAGKIVSKDRIDGKWSQGRWDLRR